MLDWNIICQFSPNSNNNIQTEKADQLLLSSCEIHTHDDNRIWSGFEEETYNYINNNDYNLGTIDFDIGLSGYTGPAYPKVYTKCFVIRTDAPSLIKPMKFSNATSSSKVNHRGETVFGIRYHFRTEDEIRSIMNCNNLLFESFFALGRPRNTYAFSCQLQKNGDQWKPLYSYTYKGKDFGNIKSLID